MDELDRDSILLRFLCEAAEDRLERVWTAAEMLKRFPQLATFQGVIHPLGDGRESEPSLAREQQPRVPANAPPRRRKGGRRRTGSSTLPAPQDKLSPDTRRKPVA